jgi:hypothetical protein
MKVELNKNGSLFILAESTVESFALTHWYDQWTKGRCTFMVQCVERSDDGNGALDTFYQPVKGPNTKDDSL